MRYCDILGYVTSQYWSSKTELIRFHSGRRELSFVEDDIVLFDNLITRVHSVRDLGVMLDSNMTMS